MSNWANNLWRWGINPSILDEVEVLDFKGLLDILQFVHPQHDSEESFV